MSSDEEEQLLDEKQDHDEQSFDTIKSELSHMSFAELQKLKEKIGTKIYNQVLFGVEKVKKTNFKRENKNRPREMSSKKQISRFREIIPVKKPQIRDPRFDTLCGTFNEKAFKHSYSFLTDVKKNDLKALKEELRSTEDPKCIKKIKYLIQRLENQLREGERMKKKEEKKAEEKKQILEAIKSGQKPVFKKKSEDKVLDLVSQYKELKDSGKLQKHIRRLRKKNLNKERKRLRDTESP